MLTSAFPHVPFSQSLPTGVLVSIDASRLSALLQSYPDRQLVRHIIEGFSSGFSIGVEGEVGPGTTQNNYSALQRYQEVSKAIKKELLAGTISGPYHKPPFSEFHCSPVTAADKPDGSARLILDMSSPRGDALNERIDKEQFTCHYSLFDNAVNMIRRVGPRAVLAKLDVKNAFRLCPVKPCEWHLLGFKWDGAFYFYVALPYGSRSSPAIFNDFANLLCWLFQYVCQIVWVDHYLDDYLFAEQSVQACEEALQAAQGLCAYLNIPLATEKVVGPTTCLTYLGIEIDTVDFTLRLPHDKYHKLLTMLEGWGARTVCTKRELLSLIGVLSFACKVIKPGRTFLRRLIDLSTTGSHLSSRVSLDSEARLDIQWWQKFLPQWNGRERIHPASVCSATWGLYTDASSVGMGGVYYNRWFSCEWPVEMVGKHINVLELFAIAAAIFVWGDKWGEQDVVIYTDNKPITDIWCTGSTKNRDMMCILRHLFYFLVQRNINVRLEHVYGYTNKRADHLSRLQVTKFKDITANAREDPDAIPDIVWRILQGYEMAF